jgi:predicted transposase/invertase (TIGR01784 family)
LFKKVLTSEGNEDIALGFVRDLFGEDVRSVRPLVPYSLERVKQNLGKKVFSRTEVDFLCTNGSGKKFLLEMQVNKTKLFDWRSLYYLCVNFCSSYDKSGNKYADLVAVRSVNLLGFVMFPGEKSLNRFRLTEIESGRLLFDDIVFELGYFEFCKPDLSGRLKDVADFFRFGKVREGAPTYLQKAGEIVKFVNLSEEEIEMFETTETYEEHYADVIEAAVEDARAEAKEDLQRSYINSLVSAGASVEFVSSALKLPIDVVRGYLRPGA